MEISYKIILTTAFLIIFSVFGLYGQFNIGYGIILTLNTVHADLAGDLGSSLTGPNGIFSHSILGTAFGSGQGDLGTLGGLIVLVGYIMFALTSVYAMYVIGKHILLATRAWGDREENIKTGKQVMVEVGKAFMIPAIVFILMIVVSTAFGLPTFNDMMAWVSAGKIQVGGTNTAVWGSEGYSNGSNILDLCLNKASNPDVVGLCYEQEMHDRGFEKFSMNTYCKDVVDPKQKDSCKSTACRDTAIILLYKSRGITNIDLTGSFDNADMDFINNYTNVCQNR